MTLKKYLSILKIIISNLFTYRLDFAMRILLTPLKLVIYYFLWKSVFLFSGSNTIGDYTFNEMITYYVITRIMSGLVSSSIDEAISKEIVEGNIVDRFLRPLSVGRYFFLEHLGIKIINFTIQTIPLTMIGIIFFNMKIPDILTLVLFSISVILAMLMHFLIVCSTGVIAFWTKEIYGISKIRRNLVDLLSGRTIPLSLFPEFFIKIFNFMPFQYIFFIPAQIFLGKQINAIRTIFIQIVWIVFLYGIYKFSWKKAESKVQGVGI